MFFLRQSIFLGIVILSGCEEVNYQEAVTEEFERNFSGIFSINENCVLQSDEYESLTLSQKTAQFGRRVCDIDYFEKISQPGKISASFKDCEVLEEICLANLWVCDVEVSIPLTTFEAIDQKTIKITHKGEKAYNAYRCK